MENKETKKEKTLKENLKDKNFVNYNILLHLKNISTHLDETKRINHAILEILNILYQKVLEEETNQQRFQKVLKFNKKFFCRF